RSAEAALDRCLSWGHCRRPLWIAGVFFLDRGEDHGLPLGKRKSRAPSSGGISRDLLLHNTHVVKLYLRDRKSTRLNSSHVSISYAVFCLKKKKKNDTSDSEYKHQVN